MIPGSPAHPPSAASMVSATAANVGPRPHPTGDPPDTLLLARGMSSRYLSSKTEHRLLPLSRANVKRDLRHFEAHRSTCGGYAQQRFVHGNRELVGGGRFVGPALARPTIDPAVANPAIGTAPAVARQAIDQPMSSAPPPPPNNHPKRKRLNCKCSHQNCDNCVVQGGVCVTHGARRKCCAHPGCEKSVKHSGYCSAHGLSWQNAKIPTPMMTTTMEAAAGTEENWTTTLTVNHLPLEDDLSSSNDICEDEDQDDICEDQGDDSLDSFSGFSDPGGKFAIMTESVHCPHLPGFV
jgi:hypothetical protein